MTAEAKEPVMERKMSQFREGSRSLGRPGSCECCFHYIEGNMIPIILNAGFPSLAVPFGAAVEVVDPD